eukprot:Gregarina_sp_Poly_1__10760@NODE_823_length_6130_cov_96_470229_g595_i0_p5_GENE_NODE_823_length_6130_cov_96_470229_g595_i0NODE_823_length_6130_cov_96_470229_g595_i0_p5_ORF_typecomplete_len142_score7_72Ig_GlcNase/PF18368_1/0_28_NODE_823_length_6130_cov_96_470229_g595_i054915916
MNCTPDRGITQALRHTIHTLPVVTRTTFTQPATHTHTLSIFWPNLSSNYFTIRPSEGLVLDLDLPGQRQEDTPRCDSHQLCLRSLQHRLCYGRQCHLRRHIVEAERSCARRLDGVLGIRWHSGVSGPKHCPCLRAQCSLTL